MGGCNTTPLSPSMATTLKLEAEPALARPNPTTPRRRFRDQAPSVLSVPSSVASPVDSCTSLDAGGDPTPLAEKDSWDEVLRQAVTSPKGLPTLSSAEPSTPGRQVLLTPPQGAVEALEDKSRVSKRQKSMTIRALPLPAAPAPRKGSKEYDEATAKATNLVRAKSLHALLEQHGENMDPLVNDLKVRLSGRRKGQDTLNAFEFLMRNQEVKEMRERSTSMAEGEGEAQGDASGLHMTIIMQEFVVAHAPRRLDVSWIPDLQRWDLEAAWEARNDDLLYELLQRVAFGHVFTELAKSPEYSDFVKDQVAAGVLAFKSPPSVGVSQRKAFLSRDPSNSSVRSSGMRVSFASEASHVLVGTSATGGELL